MKQHYFDVPFAFAGDQTAIPDPLQVGGTVSMTEGWNNNYQRNLSTDPAALPIDRSTTNWLLNQISTAIQAWQQASVPEFILASQNGGAAYSYGKGTAVLWSAAGTAPFVKYVSLTAGNTNTPSASDPQGLTTGWQAVVDPIATAAQASAGTDDASIMTPLKVAQQTALRALLAGSSSQVFNVGTAVAATQAVPLAQLTAAQQAWSQLENLIASTTLTAANLKSAFISYAGTAAATFTLPALSAMSAQLIQETEFFNASNFPLTVAVAGGSDVINTNRGAGLTSIVMQPFTWTRIFTNGPVWLAVVGNAVERGGKLQSVQSFQNHGSFTYTPTLGTQFIRIRLKGAGAGSGGVPATSSTQLAASGPGSEGAYVEHFIPIGNITSLAIVVGQAGAGGAAGSNVGVNGTATTIASLSLSAGGGFGGQSIGPESSVGSEFLATSGGPSAASGGNVQNLSGDMGGVTSIELITSATGYVYPGKGGGLQGGNAAIAGRAGALGNGCGGGGLVSGVNIAATAGAPGSDGWCIIEEYA